MPWTITPEMWNVAGGILIAVAVLAMLWTLQWVGVLLWWVIEAMRDTKSDPPATPQPRWKVWLALVLWASLIIYLVLSILSKH